MKITSKFYKFLLDEFNCRITNEFISGSNKMNYTLIEIDNFILRYISEKDNWTIDIISRFDLSKNWFPLSFVKEYIEKGIIVNSGKSYHQRSQHDNEEDISELNTFIKNNFDILSSLFNEQNYCKTLYKLKSESRNSFLRKFGDDSVHH